MAEQLNGARVAFVASDGVELVELDRPWVAIGEPELISSESGTIQAFNHWNDGDALSIDPVDYAVLRCPRGVVNVFGADGERAVASVKNFFTSGEAVTIRRGTASCVGGGGEVPPAARRAHGVRVARGCGRSPGRSA